eukprot:gene1385-1506_t
MLGLICLLFLCFLLVISIEASGHVKISEGVDKPQVMGQSPDSVPLVFTPPAAFTGPQSLYFLSSACVRESFDRWEYEVCPFRNITQRRINGNKNYLLGVWGHWVEDQPHAFHHMLYGHGKGCSSDVPSDDKNASPEHAMAHLYLQCRESRTAPVPERVAGEGSNHGRMLKITSVQETSHCVYNITLSIQLNCDDLSHIRASDMVF